jgi:hypothetical protein
MATVNALKCTFKLHLKGLHKKISLIYFQVLMLKTVSNVLIFRPGLIVNIYILLYYLKNYKKK